MPWAIRNYPPPPTANPICLKSYLLSQFWNLNPFVCVYYIWYWASHLFLDRPITLCTFNSFFRAILVALCLAISLCDFSSYFYTIFLTLSSIHFVSYAAACVVLLLSIPRFVYVCVSCYSILVPIFHYHMTIFEFPQWRKISVRFPFVLACAKLELTLHFNI